MTIREIGRGPDCEAAAALASAGHAALRAELPFLPGRDGGAFRGRIEWIIDNGRVLGLFEGELLVAFLGGFVIEDFRNAGPGAFCPDWCHGAAEGARAFDAYRSLYRELAPGWRTQGASLHAAGAYATDDPALAALAATGFGRIVLDAAQEARTLAEGLARDSAGARGGEPSGADRGAATRRATEADAASLAALDAGLAAHIGASPIFMPRTHGRDEAGWIEWLGRESAVAFVAELRGRIAGFMKAEAPQFDVSYAVHGESTLAIDGLFVEPASRGAGVGAALLAATAAEALARGKDLVSVDCETTNPEAYAFWSRRFEPVAYSFERRT
jgi:GNAT superfamily N-acetyltransferase